MLNVRFCWLSSSCAWFSWHVGRLRARRAFTSSRTGISVKAGAPCDPRLPGHRDGESALPHTSQEPICCTGTAQPVKDEALDPSVKNKKQNKVLSFHRAQHFPRECSHGSDPENNGGPSESLHGVRAFLLVLHPSIYSLMGFAHPSRERLHIRDVTEYEYRLWIKQIMCA